MSDELAVRVQSRIRKIVGGCWLWTGTINYKGYGAISVNGRTKPAHRVVYEREIGPIPSGLVLDHLCRVRNCVNPAHLEAVTTAENNRRSAPFNPASQRFGDAFAGARWRGGKQTQSHCFHGHEMTPKNTLVWSGDRRRCRECERQRNRLRTVRKAAA